MQWGVLIDGVLVVLLLTTIGYCAIVNRRLGVIRDAQQAMQDLAGDLNAATARAEIGLNQLRAATTEASEKVEPLLQQVGTAATDLDMLCHRAKKLSDKLDKASGAPALSATPPSMPPSTIARSGRAKPQAGDATESGNSVPEKDGERAAARSLSERALLEALKATR